MRSESHLGGILDRSRSQVDSSKALTNIYKLNSTQIFNGGQLRNLFKFGNCPESPPANLKKEASRGAKWGHEMFENLDFANAWCDFPNPKFDTDFERVRSEKTFKIGIKSIKVPSKKSQNMLGHSRICLHIFGYFRKSQNISEYVGISQDISEYLRISRDISGNLRIS